MDAHRLSHLRQCIFQKDIRCSLVPRRLTFFPSHKVCNRLRCGCPSLDMSLEGNLDIPSLYSLDLGRMFVHPRLKFDRRGTVILVVRESSFAWCTRYPALYSIQTACSNRCLVYEQCIVILTPLLYFIVTRFTLRQPSRMGTWRDVLGWAKVA